MLATGEDERGVVLHDAVSGEELSVLRLPPDVPSADGRGKLAYALAFSPNGDRLAAVYAEGPGRIWPTKSDGLPTTLSATGETSGGLAVNFSPDGSLVGAAAGNGATAVWDVKSGRLLWKLDGHRGPVNSLSFRQDNRQIATAGSDGVVKLWDLSSGKVQLTIDVAANSKVRGVTFARGDSEILALSGDGILKSWNTASGEQQYAVATTDVPVTFVSVSANGQQLAAVVGDTGINTYPLTDTNLLQTAQNKVLRAWQDSECKRYLRAKICPPIAQSVQAILEGRTAARAGTVDKAVEEYSAAIRLNRALEFDPKVEAAKMASVAARRLGAGGDMSGALTKLELAERIAPGRIGNARREVALSLEAPLEIPG